MSVYVDNMHETKMGKYGRMKMCHMVSENEGELHAMAARIGINRKWFQGDHYDICMSKRSMALEFGAKPITMREAVGVIKIFREKLKQTEVQDE